MSLAERRLNFLKPYIRSLREIVKVTHIESVKEAGTFLLKNALVIDFGINPQTGRDGWRVIAGLQSEAAHTKTPIYLGVVFEEDTCLGGAVKAYWKSENLRAFFLRDTQQIIIRANRVDSNLMCGVNLLHEAGHAWRAFKSNQLGIEWPREDGLPQEVIDEEIDMHFQDYSLLLERCGQPYSHLVQRVIQEVLGNVEIDLRQSFTFPALQIRHVKEFSVLVGLSSDFDSRSASRVSSRLLVHALLVKYQDDLQVKSHIMRALYQNRMA